LLLAVAIVVWWGIEQISGSSGGGAGPAGPALLSGPGSVEGSYTLVGVRPSQAGGTIDARRREPGAARGTVVLANAPFVFDGRVTCLEVESERAVIGVVGVSARPGARQRRAGLVTVVDGRGGANDSIGYDLRRGAARPDCSAPVSFASQNAASGDTLVVRGPSP
jgi:hypothetical protein